ncbi:MAG TPA: DnaJ domain-containing protein [Vicinamibacterales bacterium]|nr:DnaJ domain-containing protein [Vicinamibacterales bacterium]
MALKNYYELLELPPTATADEIKRAFRAQIARYHPDKVQHLGKEFQDMAADRAAELTEAYRILSDEGRRAEYDRASAAAGTDTAGSAAASAAPRPDAGAGHAAPPPPPPPPDTEPHVSKGPQFSQERATRDQFVRKALIGRLRQALDVIGGYDESEARSFDLAWTPKRKMFASGKGPRLLARFVSRVDGEAIADAWMQAMKWAGSEEVSVLLIGSTMAPAGELAKAIAEQRRKSRGARATLIPVDANSWDAHLPTDAPPIAKTLLSRVKSGA